MERCGNDNLIYLVTVKIGGKYKAPQIPGRAYFAYRQSGGKRQVTVVVNSTGQTEHGGRGQEGNQIVLLFPFFKCDKQSFIPLTAVILPDSSS